MVPLAGVGLGIFLFNEGQFGSIDTSPFGRPRLQRPLLSMRYADVLYIRFDK